MYNNDQLSLVRHHLREAAEKYAIAIFHPQPEYFINLADNHFREAARVLGMVLVSEAQLREAMEALERCPPTSNPTLTAEYNLERIEAWWRLEVRPVLAKLRQHLEGSHRAEK